MDRNGEMGADKLANDKCAEESNVKLEGKALIEWQIANLKKKIGTTRTRETNHKEDTIGSKQDCDQSHSKSSTTKGSGQDYFSIGNGIAERMVSKYTNSQATSNYQVHRKYAISSEKDQPSNFSKLLNCEDSRITNATFPNYVMNTTSMPKHVANNTTASTKYPIWSVSDHAVTTNDVTEYGFTGRTDNADHGAKKVDTTKEQRDLSKNAAAHTLLKNAAAWAVLKEPAQTDDLTKAGASLVDGKENSSDVKPTLLKCEDGIGSSTMPNHSKPEAMQNLATPAARAMQDSAATALSAGVSKEGCKGDGSKRDGSSGSSSKNEDEGAEDTVCPTVMEKKDPPPVHRGGPTHVVKQSEYTGNILLRGLKKAWGTGDLYPRGAVVLCRWWARGSCVKGKFCEWAHDGTPGTEKQRDASRLCQYWKTGFCPAGEKCVWAHPPPGKILDPLGKSGNSTGDSAGNRSGNAISTATGYRNGKAAPGYGNASTWRKPQSTAANKARNQSADQPWNQSASQAANQAWNQTASQSMNQVWNQASNHSQWVTQSTSQRWSQPQSASQGWNQPQSASQGWNQPSEANWRRASEAWKQSQPSDPWQKPDWKQAEMQKTDGSEWKMQKTEYPEWTQPETMTEAWTQSELWKPTDATESELWKQPDATQSELWKQPDATQSELWKQAWSPSELWKQTYAATDLATDLESLRQSTDMESTWDQQTQQLTWDTSAASTQQSLIESSRDTQSQQSNWDQYPQVLQVVGIAEKKPDISGERKADISGEKKPDIAGKRKPITSDEKKSERVLMVNPVSSLMASPASSVIIGNEVGLRGNPANILMCKAGPTLLGSSDFNVNVNSEVNSGIEWIQVPEDIAPSSEKTSDDMGEKTTHAVVQVTHSVPKINHPVAQAPQNDGRTLQNDVRAPQKGKQSASLNDVHEASGMPASTNDVDKTRAAVGDETLTSVRDENLIAVGDKNGVDKRSTPGGDKGVSPFAHKSLTLIGSSSLAAIETKSPTGVGMKTLKSLTKGAEVLNTDEINTLTTISPLGNASTEALQGPINRVDENVVSRLIASGVLENPLLSVSYARETPVTPHPPTAVLSATPVSSAVVTPVTLNPPVSTLPSIGKDSSKSVYDFIPKSPLSSGAFKKSPFVNDALVTCPVVPDASVKSPVVKDGTSKSPVISVAAPGNATRKSPVAADDIRDVFQGHIVSDAMVHSAFVSNPTATVTAVSVPATVTSPTDLSEADRRGGLPEEDTNAVFGSPIGSMAFNKSMAFDRNMDFGGNTDAKPNFNSGTCMDSNPRSFYDASVDANPINGNFPVTTRSDENLAMNSVSNATSDGAVVNSTSNVGGGGGAPVGDGNGFLFAIEQKNGYLGVRIDEFTLVRIRFSHLFSAVMILVGFLLGRNA